MKYTLLGLLILITLSANSQIQISNNCTADLQIIKTTLTLNQGKITEDLRDKFPINKIHGIDYLSFLAKVNSDFNISIFEANQILVGGQINDIISLKIPVNNLAIIDDLLGISHLQIANKIKPDLNKVVYDTHVDSVHQGIGLPQAFTGKDVFIGITDWGFDYTHPMYYDTSLTQTRIFAAWDQFKNSGPSPLDYDYGTEYTSVAELLAAEADTANIYSYALHGGHVAGIAGGSGAGTPFRGMAFESQFLFTTFLVDEGAVLDAWNWMYDIAESEGKRLVINMSWGLYYMGAPDGSDLLSEALDNYSNLGVVFVTSAGNNGDVDFHIKKTFAEDQLRTRILFYAGEPVTVWGQSIHAWGEMGKSFSAGIEVLNASNILMIESPDYSTIDTDTYIDTFLVVPGTTDSIFYNLSMDNAYPSNGCPQMRLRVKRGFGSYKIILKSNADEGTIHYWNVTETTTDVGNWGMDFQSIGGGTIAGDNFYGIGMPACSETAISVAAHASSYLSGGGVEFGGTRAAFSSIGPLMNETMKPDISAPGVSVASSISSYTDNSYTPAVTISFEGRDYPFARLSGTSMSSPVVAGIAALILEANPYLGAWQVKLIIQETAREDEHTGTIPDTGSTQWGMGKIDAYQAILRALATTGWEESDIQLKWNIYPNPTSDFISIGNLNEPVQNIEIYNLAGECVGIYTDSNSISVAHLSSGTYILRIIVNNHVQQQKFIIQ